MASITAPILSTVPPQLPAAATTAAPPYRNWNTPPETECPVPPRQQPVNEYQSLSNSRSFSWATAALPEYLSRLALTGASVALFIGLPIAAFGTGAIRDPQADGLRCALGAASAGLLAVLCMYLGSAYVGNCRLSATVEYEETGWYDGQIWVKTPEVLALDWLLGSFSVKPVLSRVKFTLVGLGVTGLVCSPVYQHDPRALPKNIESPRDPSNAGERAEAGVYNDKVI